MLLLLLLLLLLFVAIRAFLSLSLSPQLDALDSASASDLRARFSPLHKVDLLSARTGTVLRAFEFSECGGAGPHEFRGVRRRALLDAIKKDKVPEDAIR